MKGKAPCSNPGLEYCPGSSLPSSLWVAISPLVGLSLSAFYLRAGQFTQGHLVHVNFKLLQRLFHRLHVKEQVHEVNNRPRKLGLRAAFQPRRTRVSVYASQKLAASPRNFASHPSYMHAGGSSGLP